MIGGIYFDNWLINEIYIFFDVNFVMMLGNCDICLKQCGVEVFVLVWLIDQLCFDFVYIYFYVCENGVVEIWCLSYIGSVNMIVFSCDQKLLGMLMVCYNGCQQDDVFIDLSFVLVWVGFQEYVLVNLNVEYKLILLILVYGCVENLFDEWYEEVFSYVGQGCGVYGGVKVWF